jgi:DNA repair exonuclease SbcCD ATPase subunit
MKNKFFLILMFLFVFTIDQAFCATHHKKKHAIAHSKKHSKKNQAIDQQILLLRSEIATMENGTSKENIKKLNVWLNTLEAKVTSKFKHAEARLEKHRMKLNEMEDKDDAFEETSEKIRSSGKRLETCQELLTTLEELKQTIRNKGHDLF